MQFSFAGGAWIIGSSYGTLHSDAPQKLPEIEKLFPRVPARLGRFDDFTKLGFAAISLALQEAGWMNLTTSEVTGLIISTQHGVMQTDLSYYATTIEQDALLSSPNLFSYTLPVTVIGECAGFFHLTGPTFCVGDDGRSGMNAVGTALLLLQGKQTQRMIAAWIEAPPDLGESEPKRAAAAAVVLEQTAQNAACGKKTIQGIVKHGIVSNGETVTSLLAFFPSIQRVVAG